MNEQTIIAMASILGASFTMAIGALGAALGESRIGAAAMDALARQPDEASSITRTLMISLAMVESTAIFCLVIALVFLCCNPFKVCPVGIHLGCMNENLITFLYELANFVVFAVLLGWIFVKPIRKLLDEQAAKDAKLATNGCNNIWPKQRNCAKSYSTIDRSSTRKWSTTAGDADGNQAGSRQIY